MQILYRPNNAAPTPITSLSIAPRGRTIACGTMESQILLIEASTGKPKRALKGHSAMVSSVTFAEDGKAIFSGSWDCTTRKWTSRGADKDASPMKHKAEVKLVTVSENTARGAAGARNGVVKVFAVDSLRCFRNIQAHRNDISGLAFDNEGARLVTASWDGECKLWDLGTYEMIRPILKQKERIRAIAMNSDSSRVFIGLHNGTILSINLEEPLDVIELKGHTDVVTSLALDPSGNRLASGSWDRTIRIWTSSSGNERKKMKLLTGVSGVTWGPRRNNLFSSDFSGALLSWNLDKS
jgi:WD40 repeat protein